MINNMKESIKYEMKESIKLKIKLCNFEKEL